MVASKKQLEEETEQLKPRDESEILVRGVKRGRPTKPKTVKTNLDLSEDLIAELDDIAAFMGSSRQGVVKGFILSGLRDFLLFRSRNKK